jgi:hypothetical protein
VCALISLANDEKIAPLQIKGFLDKHLGKGDAKLATDAFNGPDVEMLPPGQTAWRLSNAISWIAGQTTDGHKRLELERVAALALPGGGRLHGEPSRN